METGSVEDLPRSGRRSVSDATVDRVRQSFSRSPTKSTRQASRELQVPQTTIVRILHERLRIKAYKIQIVQALNPNDCCGVETGTPHILAPNILSIIVAVESTPYPTGKYGHIPTRFKL